MNAKVEETMRKIIETLKLGNESLILDDDQLSRNITGVKQNWLLNIMESLINSAKITENNEE